MNDRVNNLKKEIKIINMNRAWIFLFVILLAIGISLLVPGVQKRIVKLATTIGGSLYIGGIAPQVQAIYVNDQLCPDSPTGPNINCVENGYNTITVKATIYDENGDCDSATATAYICSSDIGGPCNSSAADATHTKTMTYQSKSGDGLTCNFTATYDLYYFERYGDWYINVTAVDPQNYPNSTSKTFYYVEAAFLSYPTDGSSIIDLGAVNMGEWNDGKGAKYLQNTGNIRLNVTWNASDFVRQGGGSQIPIDGTNFCVDRNTDHTDGCGYINDNPLIPIEYYPSGGVHRCGDSGCSADEDGGTNDAKYYVYWDINVPTGLLSGTYNNSITVSQYAYYGAG